MPSTPTFLRALAAGLLALVVGTAAAQTPAKPAAKAAEPAKGASVEDTIRARVKERTGATPEAVTRTPWGWYEVTVGTELFYTDAQVNYVFVGRVIDGRTREDLTQARRDELQKVDYAKLPLEQAIRLRTGNGSRQFVTFEDPNCPYCRKLHKELAGMKDVTVHVFLYPILSQDSFEKAKNIWCAKDRAAAWNDAMVEGRQVPAASDDCKHPLQQTLALGQKLDISGTPTIIFPDGSRLPGAVPIAEIEKKLAAQKK